MVVGYDSFHDSTNKQLSIGGFVASTNKTMTRFISSCTIHQMSEELLNELRGCMTNALRQYMKVNNKPPAKIFFYRDGVGDGDVEYVRDYEIIAIKNVFKQMAIQVQFTYIIVSKRINTRFFHKSSSSKTDSIANPLPGTVVDDVVTLPERYDFFLVPQSVRQGTITPISCNIVHDESNLKPDHLQILTYKLCHLYFNWPGTVKLVSN